MTHKFWEIREQTAVFAEMVGGIATNALAHVVLEDDNYDDEFIEYTLDRIDRHGYEVPVDVTYEEYKAVVGYLKFLLTLPSEWRERPDDD